MARHSKAQLFRAEGAVIDWHTVDRRQLESGDGPEDVGRSRKRNLIGRAVDVQLRWSLDQELGLPPRPFTVWVRSIRRDTQQVDVASTRRGHATTFDLPEIAGAVVIECTPNSAGDTISAFGLFNGTSMRNATAAAAVRTTGPGAVTLRLNAFAIDSVRLLNVSTFTVSIEPIDKIVNDDAWKPIEFVGLPVDGSWSGSTYQPDDQGLLAAPMNPVDAAIERVRRGQPPLGWTPVTNAGVFAPVWEQVDPTDMVKEVLRDLMPPAEPLFDPSMPPGDQHLHVDTHKVRPPTQGGRTSTARTTAALPPLGLLLLAGASEPALALACGFGTSYGLEPSTIDDIQFGETDFLVTVEHEDIPGIGAGELASYIPWPDRHHRTTSPSDVEVARDGLVRPDAVDGPWRESVRIRWNRSQNTVALGRPTGTAAASYDAATLPNSTSLLPMRDAGGWRALLPVPDAPPGEPGHDTTSFVDGQAVLPLDGSNRSIGYAVAAQDVFGVWSDWTDRVHSSRAPDPPLPRIISAKLDASYAGSTVCPSVAELEVAIDWSTRTPTRLDLSLGFHPMAAVDSPIPATLGPDGAPPPGMFRVDVSVPFAGNAPSPSGSVTVIPLDAAGEAPVTPGPLQGDDGRRYRVIVPVPTLDYSATERWGVRVWARADLLALGSSTPWSPVDPPAHAVAASPIPVEPLPLPAPPGVPLGSTPDAQGRSHVRVHWALPTGATPDSVSVWEVAESSLRQSLGLATPLEGTLPGVRLAELRVAYDALSVDQRRRHFRRIHELPGTARETDVTLPKGSTDIHFFTVTTMSSTGVESSWPSGSAESTLRTAIAPRVIAPPPPATRTTIEPSGHVAVTLETTSSVPVQSFHLYRTRSSAAARRPGSMGPPFATVTATAGAVDTATGTAEYTANWTGPMPPSWRPWFIRSVAIPDAEVPPAAIRGRRSAPSDAIPLTVLPPGGPDLDPLTAAIWGAGDDGITIRTATDAQVAPTDRGPHLLRVIVDGTTVATTLDSLDVVSGQPPGSGVEVVRGATTAGETPLAIWYTRADRAVASEVTVHLTDPLGRTTTESITVPPFVPADIDLTIIDVFSIAGRGTVFTFSSDAPVDASEPGTLRVRAKQRRTLIPVLTPLDMSVALHKIPLERRPQPPSRGTAISVSRTSTRSPFQYAGFIRSTNLSTIGLGIVMEDGRTASASTRVGPRSPFDRFDPEPFDPFDRFRFDPS